MVQQNTNALDLLCKKIEGVLKLHCSPDQVSASSLLERDGAITLISAFDATRPFPERKWSLSVWQQARFPDFRLERVASRPSQSPNEISDHSDGSYAIAGTQWREPCGLHTRFSCRP
jgi:hypothetical protein